MNIFQEIKETIPLYDIAASYGIQLNRSNMCSCPFHEERTPSMKIHDKGFCCYGCGEHGDTIKFVQKLFGLENPLDAAHKINEDFHLGIDVSRRPTVSEVTAAQIAIKDRMKTQDLYMKCQYLGDLTGGKGICFATGTPVSNSISEIFIMQKYLQADLLKKKNLVHFDAWAADFAEKVTKLEYAPEGTGFRQKTRLAKFHNLPELMAMFKEFADIKTADDLNLPVPECETHNITVKPTENQKKLVQSLGERAKRIHNKLVTSDIDNMLMVTNDGRKIGLDQRLINPLLPDEPGTKVNVCVDNVFQIWNDTSDQRLTQLIFCDFSTPKGDGSFNLYDDIKNKLIDKGVPKNEVAFIHDAASKEAKENLFSKVRSGHIRILIGSTQKMGAGTNIQDKLIASHDLDCPWKLRDVGRILRTFKIKKNVEVTDNGKDDF